MNQYHQFFKETAQYINRVIGRKAVTAQMFHEWLQEAKVIKQTYGTIALISHYQRMYKHMLTEEEVERLKRAPRKTELSFRMIDILVKEGVLSIPQAKMVRQYVK